MAGLGADVKMGYSYPITNAHVHPPQPPSASSAARALLLSGAAATGDAISVSPRVASARGQGSTREARIVPHFQSARDADPHPQLRRRTAGVPERLPAP